LREKKIPFRVILPSRDSERHKFKDAEWYKDSSVVIIKSDILNSFRKIKQERIQEKYKDLDCKIDKDKRFSIEI